MIFHSNSIPTPQNMHRQPDSKDNSLALLCSVCGSPAAAHLHYGAVSCYSCRAFFRRTAPRSHSLSCRSSLGKCEISSKHKKCISCRYNKCLEIGMAPELVQVGTRRRVRRFDRINVIMHREAGRSTMKKIQIMTMIRAVSYLGKEDYCYFGTEDYCFAGICAGFCVP